MALDAAAHARALDAGVRQAVLSRALELVHAELVVTATRQRALERRWAPLLSDAIGRLESALDELEREDAVRARWLHCRGGR